MSKDRFFSGGGQSEIDALQTVTEYASWTSTGVTGAIAKKMGKLVDMQIYVVETQTAPSAGWHYLEGTLKPELIPDVAVSFAATDNSATDRKSLPLLININTQGKIGWYASSDKLQSQPRGHITYIVP